MRASLGDVEEAREKRREKVSGSFFLDTTGGE